MRAPEMGGMTGTDATRSGYTGYAEVTLQRAKKRGHNVDVCEDELNAAPQRQRSKQNDGQRSWIPTASIKRPDSLQLQHVSPIIALAVRAATDPELLLQNRSRQGAEIGANPDGSGRSKIPGLGGRQNLVTF